MNLVNNFFKQEHKQPITGSSNLYSTKSLKIIALSLMVIGLLVAAGCLLASIITGNPIIAALALPGIALSIPSILLLLQTRKKVATPPKQVSGSISPPEKAASPTGIRTPERATSPTQVRTPERAASPTGIRTPERVASPTSPEGIPFPESTNLGTQDLLKRLFPNASVRDSTKYYRSAKTGMTLCFSKSSLETPAIPLTPESDAIVFNDANPNLNPSLITWGTSANLKKWVTNKSWWGSSGSKDFLPLGVGTVRVSRWESSQNFREKYPSLTKIWSYLGHIVTPENKDNSTLPSHETFKSLYRKALNMAFDLHCNVIQLPVFKFFVRHVTAERSPDRNRMDNIILQALLITLAEMERELMHDPEKSSWLNNLTIVIVDPNQLPYGGVV